MSLNKNRKHQLWRFSASRFDIPFPAFIFHHSERDEYHRLVPWNLGHEETHFSKDSYKGVPQNDCFGNCILLLVKLETFLVMKSAAYPAVKSEQNIQQCCFTENKRQRLMEDIVRCELVLRQLVDTAMKEYFLLFTSCWRIWSVSLPYTVVANSLDSLVPCNHPPIICTEDTSIFGPSTSYLKASV
jgi:hypothetical protein